MSKVSSQAAAQALGNRYDLILVGAERIRELRRGDAARVANPGKKMGVVETALTEIAQGQVGYEMIGKMNRRINDAIIKSRKYKQG